MTLLFVQGWRVSEVLGLAWEDLNLDAGTAHIQRGAAYTKSVGTVLGPTKTSGAEGIHHLAPIAVEALCRRRDRQDVERQRFGGSWPSHTYEGVKRSMVFTTTLGGLVNRQSVIKEIDRAAKAAGIGHSDPATTAEYVRSLGQRPVDTARRAAKLLDPTVTTVTSNKARQVTSDGSSSRINNVPPRASDASLTATPCVLRSSQGPC